MKIKSKMANVVWNIDTEVKLAQEDISFIENLNPTIYHNDQTCKLWALMKSCQVDGG